MVWYLTERTKTQAFIGKLFGLDTGQRYRVITCGEEVHRKYQYADRSRGRVGLLVLIPASLVAYNRVALTDYFQHRNIEKLYLESRAPFL